MSDAEAWFYATCAVIFLMSWAPIGAYLVGHRNGKNLGIDVGYRHGYRDGYKVGERVLRYEPKGKPPEEEVVVHVAE